LDCWEQRAKEEEKEIKAMQTAKKGVDRTPEGGGGWPFINLSSWLPSFRGVHGACDGRRRRDRTGVWYDCVCAHREERRGEEALGY
jgi:hypothetical protein